MTQKTASDFAHFYSTTLLKELKQLDKLRRAVLRKVLILLAVTAGVFLLSVVVDRSYELSGGFMLMTGVACFGVCSFLYRFLISGYVHEFKLRVIKQIVRFIDPSLIYWPKGHILAMEFISSRIFERNPDRLRGDDMVEGRIGKTKVKFSEVHAEYKVEMVDSYGRRRTGWRTVFKGLFFTADFNKHFYGKTVVLPDTAERLFGGMGTFLQSLNSSRGDLIKLEDPEFEKYFVVYGDDQIESRYVLSTSLMERILDFRRKTGKRIYLSFVGSQMFVAIPYRKPLFEPKVFSSITGFKSIRGYFEYLQLAIGIVEDLNLNTRIWTRREARKEPPHPTRDRFSSSLLWPWLS